MDFVIKRPWEGKGDFEPIEKRQVIVFYGKKFFESPIFGIILLQRPEEIWCFGELVGYIARKYKCLFFH